MFKLMVLASVLLATSQAARLTVSGRDFYYNNQKVFLSGVNIAWNSYGYDFGNDKYNSLSRSRLEGFLTQVANNGGNSVRIWLHVEGENTPEFDGNGFVTGPDSGRTLINDMRSFLDFAQNKNILVIFVLWNGAEMRNDRVINLFYDDSKMQSYIQNALKPMVSALGNHPALAAWEIMNEPEGSIYKSQQDSNPCFDTKVLDGTGAGWTDKFVPIKNFLRGINWQAAAIKEVNSGSLVTVGSWSEHAQTDRYPKSRNYYTDACLFAAGGKSAGKLDFYQMHTYTSGGVWNPDSPFKVQGSSYGLDKPLIIGEFATTCSMNEGVTNLFQHAYQSYQGIWTWQYNEEGDCHDTQSTQNAGMNHLRGAQGPGGVVNFPVN